MNQDPWSSSLADDSDKSSCKSSPFSNRSSDSSNESSTESSFDKELSSDKEDSLSGLGSYEIITKSNLHAFVQKIDLSASMDDQAYDMMGKIADAFVNDVALRIVKLAKYRKERLGLLDLKFIFKREYNMEFGGDTILTE
ncbi:transcription initiation factor TFIID subunit 12 isoform X1 [Drosophila ananassae]|nr:transcription initiation factor TFIID subunit 12 isoform X1 [Drosophila ananassae]